IAVLYNGDLQKLGRVRTLLEDASRVEIQASAVDMTDELRRDLEDLLRKHGGRLESVGHCTTTPEGMFPKIAREAKAHPPRRHQPEEDAKDGREGAAKPGREETRVKRGKKG